MYVCGMTVYDYCHLGHARVMVVFDMIARYLREQNYRVNYVRNITDIDDKIINRANENNEPIEALTGRFIAAMHQDAAALGVLPPDQEPRATEHIDQIIAMITALIDNGYAYHADNNDVYFNVSRARKYGVLSGKNIDELRAGERVAVRQGKDDPLDFVLWKASKPNEPCWDSPWCKGRPGWHIECSAMSTHCLGDHFDIHGGGRDLQFPHHENEIVQSECATGESFVNVWVHNGFVRVDEEKMSKSLNNFFTVRELLSRYPAEVLRFFILSSHYRSPLGYSAEVLQAAKLGLSGLYTCLRDGDIDNAADTAPDKTYLARFNEAMDDDFNTVRAIALLHELAHAAHRAGKGSETSRRCVATLKRLGAVLGLLQDDPLEFLQRGNQAVDADAIQALIDQRNQARADKDFVRADRIREQLTRQGIALEDTANGTLWRSAQ